MERGHQCREHPCSRYQGDRCCLASIRSRRSARAYRALEAIAPSIRVRIGARLVDLEGGLGRAQVSLTSLLPLDAERQLESFVLVTLCASALTESGL